MKANLANDKVETDECFKEMNGFLDKITAMHIEGEEKYVEELLVEFRKTIRNTVVEQLGV
jgi:hypothetical protein